MQICKYILNYILCVCVNLLNSILLYWNTLCLLPNLDLLFDMRFLTKTIYFPLHNFIKSILKHYLLVILYCGLIFYVIFPNFVLWAGSFVLFLKWDSPVALLKFIAAIHLDGSTKWFNKCIFTKCIFPLFPF